MPLPLTVKLITEMNLAGTRPDFRIYPADHIGSLCANEADAATFIATVFACESNSEDPECAPASGGSLGSHSSAGSLGSS